MISYSFKTLKDKQLRSLKQFRVGSWVVATDPTQEELELLEKELSLDPGHLRDALDPYEVPRLESEGEVVYIFLRIPTKQKGRVTTQVVLFVLGPTYVAAISKEPLALHEQLAQHPDFYTSQKIKCFILVGMQILNHYYTSLTYLGKRMSNVRSNVEQATNADILELVHMEQSLNEMLSSIIPMHSIFNTLLTGKTVRLYKQDRELVEDLFLSSGQVIELSKNRLSTVRNMREAYSTIMTNNLNKVMKRFTTLTVILTVPTIISSFYGMNVVLPFAEHPLAFMVIMATTIISLTGLIVLFLRKNWL